jgi:1,4-dihydroxy-2-naphthoyl-CoA hydrolase
MSIWFQEYTLEELREIRKGTLADHIGIRITEIGPDYVRGTMPVDERTYQPLGMLHGGASVVLSETLGSLAANMVTDPAKNSCVGAEVNANHLRPARSGVVTGTARPVHIGRSLQVWQTEIVNTDGQLVCISRLTMVVLDRPHLQFGRRAPR